VKEIFSAKGPYRSFTGLYEKTCDAFSIECDFEKDLNREATLQKLVTQVDDVEIVRKGLSKLFTRYFSLQDYPRSAVTETNLKALHRVAGRFGGVVNHPVVRKTLKRVIFRRPEA